MFKRLLSTTLLSSLFVSLALADDFLAQVSKGALSDNSVGVKALSVDEMKQVQGGYRILGGNFNDGVLLLQQMNLGLTNITQIGLAIKLEEFEIENKVSCGFNSARCDHLLNSYRAQSDYADVASIIDPRSQQYLAITATKTTRPVVGPFGATQQVQFSEGYAVLQASSGGRIYKVRNTDARGFIAGELKFRFQRQLNNVLAVQY